MHPRHLGLLLLGLAACGGSNAASHLAQAPAYAPKDQTKCRVSKSQDAPLIVEWPSAARLALEAQSKRGPVVVRYDGCEMKVLRGCRMEGSYAYTPTTRQDDQLVITDEDELYANIPVYAAKFAGELRKSGQLNVAMSLVGTYDAELSDVHADRLEGDCEKATHVLSSLTIGAFEFYSGATGAVGANVEVASIAEAGAKSEARRVTLNKAGERAACGEASSSDEMPPDGCGAIVRVEVREIDHSRRAAPVVADHPEPVAAAAPSALPASTSTAPAAIEEETPLEPTPVEEPPEALVIPQPQLPEPVVREPEPAVDGGSFVHIESPVQGIELYRLHSIGVVRPTVGYAAYANLGGGGYATYGGHALVCVSPCDSRVPSTITERYRLKANGDWIGPEFRLDGKSEARFDVRQEREASPALKGLGITGIVLGSLGTAFGAINLIYNAADGEGRQLGGYAAGGVALGAGVAVLVGGSLMYVFSKPLYGVDIHGTSTVGAAGPLGPWTF